MEAQGVASSSDFAREEGTLLPLNSATFEFVLNWCERPYENQILKSNNFFLNYIRFSAIRY